MRQHCRGSASQNGGHPATLSTDASMPKREDTLEDRDQQPSLSPHLIQPLPQPKIQKLPSRDDPMLPLG